MYFSGIIEKELAKVEKQNTPETKQLVKDALYRMHALEEDYNNLTKELQENGENKKIIHAMITNLQTRISFLEEVLTQIENIKKIKQNYHENHQA
jgi:galactokinase/mevalonate kinase-like predicted kinase